MDFYGNADDFIEYSDSRGRMVPAVWDTDRIEAALIVASEWIDNKYGDKFTGYRTDGYTQKRQWPRQAAFSNTLPPHNFATDEIPPELAQATYEAAFREAENPGSLNVDFTPDRYTEVAVEGAIRVKYTQNLQIADRQLQINIIDSILRYLIDETGSTNTLGGGGGGGLSGGSCRR